MVSSMRVTSLVDVGEGEWFRVDPRTGDSLLHQGERLRHSLRLAINPVTLRTDSVRIDGIAGAILAHGTQFQIMPKVLSPHHGRWVEGLNAYLNYAGRGSTFLTASRTRRAPLSSFLDNTALQFCEMLELASKVGLPLTYTKRRTVGQSPRGPLDITASLRNLASLKPTLEWDEETLHEDTSAARVIRLALQLLARQCRDARVQRRVELNLSVWPVVPPIRSRRVPTLSRSFSHFRPVVTLASEICHALGRCPGTVDAGYAYVVDMVKTFERTVERGLMSSSQLFEDRMLSVVRQDSVRYAHALTIGAIDYYSRPDAVVYDGGIPLAVVDAKYKSFGEGDDASARPANTDFYQVLAAAIAHGTRLALLVYPASFNLIGGTVLAAWQIPICPTKVVTIAAGTVNLVGLSPGTTPDQMHLQLKRLLEELIAVAEKHE